MNVTDTSHLSYPLHFSYNSFGNEVSLAVGIAPQANPESKCFSSEQLYNSELLPLPQLDESLRYEIGNITEAAVTSASCDQCFTQSTVRLGDSLELSNYRSPDSANTLEFGRSTDEIDLSFLEKIPRQKLIGWVDPNFSFTIEEESLKDFIQMLQGASGLDTSISFSNTGLVCLSIFHSKNIFSRNHDEDVEFNISIFEDDRLKSFDECITSGSHDPLLATSGKTRLSDNSFVTKNYKEFATQTKKLVLEFQYMNSDLLKFLHIFRTISKEWNNRDTQNSQV